MALTRVGIRNFRNIAEASDIGLAPTLTVVSGANAQGKSNFLEALGVLLSGLSLRGQGDREMIREGTEGYRLTGDWVVGGETAPLLCTAAVDPPRRRREGPQIPVVMFSPDDVLVVKGGPEGRRRLLDLLLSQMHPHYVRQLRVYQRAVAQRNRALKGGAADAVLDSFAPALAESGAYVWARRRELIALLAPELASVAARLAPADTPALALARGGHADTDDAAGLLRELDRRRGEERARGLTLTGPHRDDLEIRLNGRSARLYGSQGQQRTLALGLKMAARTVLEHHVGIPPVVLLDDVLSELDDTRRRALLDLVAAGTQQTVVTDAQGDGYRDLAARRLLVDGGRIRDAAGEGR